MESREARKSSPSRHRTHRKRRSSGDKVDHQGRAEAMFNPKPSANATLSRRDRPAAHYEDSTYGSQATEEHARVPDARGNKQASPEPQQAPFFISAADIPSADELARLQLYVQLRAQAEGIVPAQGHSYGRVKVNDNGIVFAGNAFDSDKPEQQIIARRHKYDDFETGGSGVVLIGDTTHKGMALAVDKQRNEEKVGHRHYGDRSSDYR